MTIKSTLFFMSLFIIPSAFAVDFSGSWTNAEETCGIIAKACAAAGYTDGRGGGRRLWNDCMKPLLLNKPVAKVNVSSITVSTCRAKKIEDLRKELDDLQSTVEGIN